MTSILDYEITNKIYESANSLVYQGILQPDNQPIILKILKENNPNPAEITRYKQEYEITVSLNTDSVIKAYNLQRYKNSLVILLEDFGGQSLNLLIPHIHFSLAEFLTVTIKIVESLAAIHTANIIHKDINPANIVYNQETGQLKIIDFGISTRLTEENWTGYHINQLEGTLAYISPEQTGRMNRGIDYRSDFYSLGVTFYEILTGQLPFTSKDPMELVHCHIAQHPKRPDEIISSIPLIISEIIIKLLAKSPEERYQNACGIKADLEKCLSQLTNTGQILKFHLGEQDISSRFHIPQKLYGREQEITQLLTIFEHVSQGNTAMMLVSGYSGIGKSALVNEIYKPITRQRGFFIRGKFDQLQRDIPYAAITQAFQDLIRQLLSENEVIVKTWKEKILAALGNNGQIIIDIISDLEKIIDKQPIIEQLGVTETQNRFIFFFQRFIDIFSKKEHPLVIFLDDLQWADIASLNLIEKLVTNTNSKYLLIIGAYRNNEISPTHPLTYTLEKIKKAEAIINQIILQSLEISHINELIADTLNCSIEYARPLAELVSRKTGGNPFFSTQLLKTLYKEKLLVFNTAELISNQGESRGKFWQWEIEQIQKVGITDNIIELMNRKISQLDKTTQNILKFAACIGNKFNIEILSIISRKSQSVTAQELQPALNEGLIIPLSEDYKFPLLWSQEEISNDTFVNSSVSLNKYPKSISYKFLHDRVRQAAYKLIQEEEKKKTHLQIGRLMWKIIQSDDLAENIFSIVNQLNEGGELITEKLEKDELAKLNLKAAKRSKLSASYEPALRYSETGLKFLASNSWDEQYELTFDLHIEALELLYLNNRFEQFEDLANQILSQAKNILDQSKVNQLQIIYYTTTFKNDRAIDTALTTLQKFGINISQKNDDIEKIIGEKEDLIKSFLRERKVEDFADLPVMRDRIKIAAMLILKQIITGVAMTNYQLFVEVVLTQINLCMEYGNPPHAPSIYSNYGVFLCGVKKDINYGYDFGKLSLTLLEKFGTSKLEAFIPQGYYGHICHWKESISNVVAENKLIHAFNIGIEIGEHEYAAYSAINYCLIKFLSGQNLINVDQNYQKYSKIIRSLEQHFSIHSIKMLHKIAINFLTPNDNGLIIGSSIEEEKQYLQTWTQSNNSWLIFFVYFAKTVNFYFSKNYIEAYNNGFNAEKHAIASSAYLTAPHHNFYSSLSFLAYYNFCDVEQKVGLLEQVDKNQDKMKYWAECCSENFQHKYDLVAAERARALGQSWQAENLYEKAIQGAKKNQFIHEEALAYERAGEFYLDLEREEIGELYLRNAHACYTSWGAEAKVQQLEDEYRKHFIGTTIRTTKRKKAKKLSTSVSTTGNDGEILDLTTVIKASQAIAGEIILENLLASLMKIMIENAGAQKGFLLLQSPEKSPNNQAQWVIEAAGAVDTDDMTVLQSVPVDYDLDYIDPSNQTPLLSIAIINYVAHAQENVVLNDATSDGQFTRDPYIITNQPKSILCAPLLNQGRLNGILYLENNLTTGAFTKERLEVLNILSSQAAISIENSRLYATLEEKVAERTRELSQTLEILQATQAKLVFENALLKPPEQGSIYNYQVGGSLSSDAPTYVVRSADRYLYKVLMQGDFCYILNTRQMGKSSLMVRMMNHLRQEGIYCAAIDMTRLGSEDVTAEQWYKGLAVELWQSFDLVGKVNLKSWWKEQLNLPPVQQLSRFFDEIILREVKLADDTLAPQIVIFLDELDCILGLDFAVNDFFALVRSCYNQRAINSDYKRLCFVLLGVATPSDLITDNRRTPFNIGQAVEIKGFKLDEAQPLLQGLTDKVSNPQAVLKEVLFWTNGQPFLTQKICSLIRNSSNAIAQKFVQAWIEDLVRKNIIENWEAQDEPEHLRTIRDRILKGEKDINKMLKLYQQVLEQGQVSLIDTPESRELILSGLLIKHEGHLIVHNRIYELIFNSDWVRTNQK